MKSEIVGNARLEQFDQSIKQSQKLLEYTFASLRDSIFVLSDDPVRIIDCNPAASEVFGYSRDELIGRLTSILHVDETALEEFRRLLKISVEKNNLQHQFEFRMKRRDGTIFHTEHCVVALEDDQHKRIGWISVVRDITERERAEEALQQTEKNYREVFDKVSDAIFIHDPETGAILDVNNSMLQMYGFTREEALAVSSNDASLGVSPYSTKEAREWLTKTITEGPQVFEWQARKKDGNLFWVEVSLRSAEINGQLRILALVRDITDRKQAEKALQESEQRFRTLAEALPMMIWQCKPDLNCDYFNESWLEFTGRTIEKELGSGWAEGVHPEDLQRCLETFTSAVARREPFEMEYRLRHHSGEYRWIFDRGVPRFAANRTFLGYLGSCLDISERKRAEEELAAAKRSAEQANQAKDHFLAVLSHELRTPLTPVVMGVSMLQERRDFEPKVLETLEMIRRNVEMEARLIDDLLDVTRIARGKIELNRGPVDLRVVVQRAVEVCKPDIEARGVQFGMDFGAAEPYWVEADVSRLQQVFWNLLKNAIKFTPHGGCIEVRCRPDEGHVLCEVNDSGIGIEAEALTRIFSAFEQAERSHNRQFGGLGLGLAISKALVEMHDGEIEANSEGRGKGATFRIRLPLSVRQPEVRIPAVSPPSIVCPLHILLVEDHGVTAQMIRMVLTEKGHMVEVAGDVSTALELAGRHKFDLLLSDLGLRDESGLDLMRELRMRGHKLAGIALSGYGQEDDISRSYAAGFAAHLTKPATPEAIIETVASIVTARNERPPTHPAEFDTPV